LLRPFKDRADPGVGDEDIDPGKALSCSIHGPLEAIDFIGLDTELSIAETLYEETKNTKYAPSLLLIKRVTAGWLARKTGKGFYEYK